MLGQDTRRQAMTWWNGLLVQHKEPHVKKHYFARKIESLTGREIEIIWRKEIMKLHTTEEVEKLLNLAMATASAYGDLMGSKIANDWISDHL